MGQTLDRPHQTPSPSAPAPPPTYLVNSSGNVGVLGGALQAYGTGLMFDDATSLPHSTTGSYLCVTTYGTAISYGASCSSSDARLKKDVAALSNIDALQKVLALEPVSFRGATTTEDDPTSLNSTSTQIGSIAQQVLPVVPEVANMNAGGFYSLDYAKLTPILAGAIQQMNLKLEDLATTSAEIDDVSFTSRFVTSLFTRITT